MLTSQYKHTNMNNQDNKPLQKPVIAIGLENLAEAQDKTSKLQV